MYEVDICACFVDASASEVDEARRESNKGVYTCPAWMNFRLDVSAVLNAMFPASPSLR